MMNDKELDLLIDLAKLLRRYGADIFKSLAEHMASPELNESVSKVLSEIAERVPSKSRKTKKGPRQTFPSLMDELKLTNPQKQLLLQEILDGLMNKFFLPTLSDLKAFSDDSNLSKITTKSRKTAINQLLFRLAELPEDQILKIVESLKTTGSGDRSLQSWSNLILGKPTQNGRD